jgi:flagellar basal body-associated protein FliL
MLKWICLGILLLSASGCVVQSYHPFYTKDSIVPQPAEVQGQWEPEENNDYPISLVFSKLSFSIDIGESIQPFAPTFFKLGTQLYCDITIDGFDDEAKSGFILTTSIINVHTLYKVTASQEELELWPLNKQWLAEAIKKQTVSLPYLNRDDQAQGNKQNRELEDALFTAKPEQWREFLEKHAADEKLFDKESALKFSRNTEKMVTVLPSEPQFSPNLYAANQITINDLNYSIPMPNNTTATLSMSLTLHLGLSKKEIEHGVKISEADWKSFCATVSALEPAIRDKIMGFIADMTYAQLSSASGKERIKQHIKDFVNSRLEKLEIKLENPDLDRKKVVEVYMPTFYLQQ